ncbi:MAG: peroxiredoxin [Paracoccaceae bacterium]|nr:antioxidant, AhpC/Tsa family protein [Rhodobacterales bacterium HTCC2150] [Rhodobacteraceae bacterium HTCC2150]MDG1532218.1 peroxiredoxin [Paracoccaceae bacterium]
MTLSVGDTLPNATLRYFGDDGPATRSIEEITKGRKVVIFGLPGAYTRTCSAAHVPSFIRTKDQFDAKGIDEVICVSVNDVFVMQSWGIDTGATEVGITMLADPVAEFTKAIDMLFTGEPVGLIDRCKRFSLVAEDGVVTVYHEETEKGGCTISSGEDLLAAI